MVTLTCYYPVFGMSWALNGKGNHVFVRDCQASVLQDRQSRVRALEVIRTHRGFAQSHLLEKLLHGGKGPQSRAPGMFNRHPASTFDLPFGSCHTERRLSFGLLLVGHLLNQGQFCLVKTIPSTPMFAFRTQNQEFWICFIESNCLLTSAWVFLSKRSQPCRMS